MSNGEVFPTETERLDFASEIRESVLDLIPTWDEVADRLGNGETATKVNNILQDAYNLIQDALDEIENEWKWNKEE